VAAPLSGEVNVNNVAKGDMVNILMVDDQPGKLLTYEAILSELGENLLKANSAREALEHLLRTEVAVVLIDVCMPELDGFELAAMIREHPRFERIAIIFVSAVQITDIDRLKGYAAGAVDYVPVPVVPEVLRAKVKVFAELFRKTQQLEQLNSDLERRVAERTAALEASTARLESLNEMLESRIEERTREREQALAQLFEAQKLDTIGKLTGGVAHDFNNLLTAILGSLQLLGKRLPHDPRADRLLQNAIQGAQRGAALTQRLLAFARRQDLKPESVDLVALIAGMDDLIERALGPGIRMLKILPDNLPRIRVDANQLELALLNLVVNARDAMPLSGVLTLRATVLNFEQDANARLSPGSYVKLSVTDNGAGMDAATLAKATEPFFTTKGPGKGTGLGLSMVHGLAIQSGGEMVISSKPGEGTNVDLLLPQSEKSAEIFRDVISHAGANPGIAPQKVLVVDDDPLVSLGTSEMLSDLGHNVTEADSGEEALRLLQANPDIKIVITDHSMPGMTGVELAARIRASSPDVVIVLASGYAELPNNADEKLNLPRLAKPYCQEDLAALLATLCRRAESNVLKIHA
jgi:signal transduction histidine kinase